MEKRRSKQGAQRGGRAGAPRSTGHFFPLSTNLIEGAFSEGGECVLSPPRPFRQSSRPGVRDSRSSGRFVSLLAFALTKARRRTPSEGGPVLLYQVAPQQLP